MSSLSVPQSEETRAELSQIAWVPRQVRYLHCHFLWTCTEYCSDHLAPSQQTCHGHCAGHSVRYSKVHPTRYLPRLECGAKYPLVGAGMGRDGADTRHHQA